MRTLSFFLVLLLVPAVLEAQDNTADGKFWAVNALVPASVAYDTESTLFALQRCGSGCKEANPFMRPLVEAGRLPTYAVKGAVGVGVIFLSHELKKNNNKQWWLPPVVMAAVLSAAGTNNVRIALRF